MQIDTSKSLSLPHEYSNGDRVAQNHSPASNDSGFHGDLMANDSENSSRTRNSPRDGRFRGPRPTYVSVFDNESEDVIYRPTAERFTRERPRWLKTSLDIPESSENRNRIVDAPVILPSALSKSAGPLGATSPTFVFPTTRFEAEDLRARNDVPTLDDNFASFRNRPQIIPNIPPPAPPGAGFPTIAEDYDPEPMTKLSRESLLSDGSSNFSELSSLRNDFATPSPTQLHSSSEPLIERPTATVDEELSNVVQRFDDAAKAFAEAEALEKEKQAKLLEEFEILKLHRDPAKVTFVPERRSRTSVPTSPADSSPLDAAEIIAKAFGNLSEKKQREEGRTALVATSAPPMEASAKRTEEVLTLLKRSEEMPSLPLRTTPNRPSALSSAGLASITPEKPELQEADTSWKRPLASPRSQWNPPPLRKEYSRPSPVPKALTPVTLGSTYPPLVTTPTPSLSHQSPPREALSKRQSYTASPPPTTPTSPQRSSSDSRRQSPSISDIIKQRNQRVDDKLPMPKSTGVYVRSGSLAPSSPSSQKSPSPTKTGYVGSFAYTLPKSPVNKTTLSPKPSTATSPRWQSSTSPNPDSVKTFAPHEDKSFVSKPEIRFSASKKFFEDSSTTAMEDRSPTKTTATTTTASGPYEIRISKEEEKPVEMPRCVFDISRIVGNISEDEIIGRPVALDWREESEEKAVTPPPIPSADALPVRDKPSLQEIAESKEILGASFSDYDVFVVNLKRPSKSLDASLGLIFTSAASTDNSMTVQKVVTGSIADRSLNIDKGDKVFFIQGCSTRQMETKDARALIKTPSELVRLVLGRPVAKPFSQPLELSSTVTIDPETFQFSEERQDVVLTKGSLGVGIAFDGGRGSVYGDRPIVVKSVYEGGSAAKDGRIAVGDRIVAIEGISTEGMSYTEANQTLRSCPKGPVKITFRKRL